MKKLLCLMLAALICVFAACCGSEEEGTDTDSTEAEPTVCRSFIAGYEQAVTVGETASQLNGRVLMRLWTDGGLDIYVGFGGMGTHSTYRYEGTYTVGKSAEGAETLSFTYTYGEGEGESASVANAEIVDGVFEAPFYMVSSMTSSPMSFYETAPMTADGDVYVGYLTKSSGMGTMVYAYALSMMEDGSFSVSVTRMLGSHRIWGESQGTYSAEGSAVTFTYGVSDGAGGIVEEGYISVGNGLTDTELTAGFNIGSTDISTEAARALRVN